MLRIFTIFLCGTLCLAQEGCGVSADGICTSQWSEWSACFKDENLGYSWKDSILIMCPGSTDGASCPSDNYVNKMRLQQCDGNATADATTANILEAECPEGEYSKCGNGRCIGSALACNGDDDCGDASDEYPNNKSCAAATKQFICGFEIKTTTSSTPPVTDRYFLGIPGIERFATGFDILTGESRGDVLSMNPYGSCRRILKSGTEDYYYRLPGNVNSFIQVEEVSEGLGSVVTSGAEMINSTQRLLFEDDRFGGNIDGVSGYVGLSQSTKYSEYMTDSIYKGNKYTMVTTTMNVGVYKIQLQAAKHLQVTNSFIQRLCELPWSDYSYSKYMALINDFGTHYVSAGTLGGTYEVSTYYDRCWLDDSYEYEYGNDQWRENLLFCGKANLRQLLNPLDQTYSVCTSQSGVNIVDEAAQKVVDISGGSVSEVANLQASFETTTWKAWVATLNDAPSIIMEDFKLERIDSLLDIPGLPLNNTQRRKIKDFIGKTIEQYYLQPYNASGLCTGNATMVYCKDQCGDIDDEEVTEVYPVPYLVGRGPSEYRCLCACDRSPNYLECSSLRATSSIFLSLFLCLMTLIQSS